MSIRALTALALSSMAFWQMGCGSDKASSSCDECRQQNAPLETALNLEPGPNSSSNLEAAPKANIKDDEINKDAGAAPAAIGQAQQLKSSPEIEQATKELLSNQGVSI